VPGIQRIDLEEGEPLTERELRRRWAQFHGAIRIRSGKPIRRFIGRMLGENTLRYKVARFFGRPILKVVRLVKGEKPAEIARPVFVHGISFFPLNFRPSDLPKVENLKTLDQKLRSVEVYSVDETDDSPSEAIDALNETLATTSASWLFLHDASTSREEQFTLLSTLLDHVEPADDVVYADEFGPHPASPILKSPGVGPHTLWSYNVIGRPALLRVATLRAIGGFSRDARRAFEHDAYLRLSESGSTFHHVPLIVTHGRPPISFSPAHIDQDSCRVVEAALARRGLSGSVAPGVLGGLVEWRLDVPSPPPSIDIIIPTRDRIDLVVQCIEAIESKSTYSNYDIIILDNDSKEPETLEYFANTKYRVVPCPGPFNYAHIVNRGVRHSTAQFVLTLNNDTILITPDWLERLVSLASLDDVGFVGGCLIDQDGRFEHESIVISPYPQHLRSDSNYPHQDHFVFSTRDVAAVTGAVQIVKRELWDALGGMDEELKVTMNDIDICLRSQLDGHHVIYTPDVRLFHHVGSSRGKLDPLDDRNRFIRRWDIFGSFQDPYFPESILLLGEQVYFRHR
jgi:GT2 family glycosyltransferase